MERIKVGDLVSWKVDLPFVCDGAYGIVVKIIDGYLVGVLWSNSHYVYMEAIKHLEVINEKANEKDKKRYSSDE